MKHGLIHEDPDHFREMVTEFKNHDVAPSFLAQESKDVIPHPLHVPAGITGGSPSTALNGVDGTAVNAEVREAVTGRQKLAWAVKKNLSTRAEHRQLRGDQNGAYEHLPVQQYWQREHSPSMLVSAR
ncbi:MAG: hypothetical protein ABWX89_08390 [Paeniglutamicibacter terrestris]